MPPQFRHVELWRAIPYGPGVNDVMWITVVGTYEFLTADIDMDPTPPWLRSNDCAVQYVTATRRLNSMRDWFSVGPPTCVEMVKAALGIQNFFLRTPFQLYKYIHARGGVIRN